MNDAIEKAIKDGKAVHEALTGGCLFLDTETTGLDDAQIVSVAICDHEGKTLLDTLVKPTVSIPADATAIHGHC